VAEMSAQLIKCYKSLKKPLCMLFAIFALPPASFRSFAQIISLMMIRAQGRGQKYLCCGIFKVSILVMEVVMRQYICKPEYHLQSFIRAMRCLNP